MNARSHLNYAGARKARPGPLEVVAVVPPTGGSCRPRPAGGTTGEIAHQVLTERRTADMPVLRTFEPACSIALMHLCRASGARKPLYRQSLRRFSAGMIAPAGRGAIQGNSSQFKAVQCKNLFCEKDQWSRKINPMRAPHTIGYGCRHRVPVKPSQTFGQTNPHVRETVGFACGPTDYVFRHQSSVKPSQTKSNQRSIRNLKPPPRDHVLNPGGKVTTPLSNAPANSQT